MTEKEQHFGHWLLENNKPGRSNTKNIMLA